MQRRWWAIGLGALVALALTVNPAMARDRGILDDLNSYFRILDPRAELAARTATLGERVRRSEQRGDLRRSDADDLHRRLDRVRRFLRDDRNLSRDEFRRRERDLDSIEQDLDRRLRSETRSERRRDDYRDRD